MSVSLAEELNEVVAMDLKFIESNIILHLIDHVTRFSAAAIVKSKEREEIIKHLFRSWISIFGLLIRRDQILHSKLDKQVLQ